MQGRTGKRSSSVFIQLPGESHFSGNLVFSNHHNVLPYFCGYFISFSSLGENFFPPQCVSDNFPDLLIILLPDPHSLWKPIWHLRWG